MKNRLSEIIGVSLLALVVLLVYSVQGWSQQETEEILAAINQLPPLERQQKLEGAPQKMSGWEQR